MALHNFGPYHLRLVVRVVTMPGILERRRAINYLEGKQLGIQYDFFVCPHLQRRRRYACIPNLHR
jgi:hypothetical protein